MAGFGAVQNVTAASIVPNLVAPERLRSALALNYGLNTLTMVIGPALGGVLIAVLGLGAAYTVDAVELPGDPRRRLGDGAPAAAGSAAEAASPRACCAVDRRGPALRARQPAR